MTSRKQFEQKRIEVGVQFGKDSVDRLCRAWVHHSEENELANLAAPIHYYSRLPPKY